jgi:hypothetical protein
MTAVILAQVTVDETDAMAATASSLLSAFLWCAVGDNPGVDRKPRLCQPRLRGEVADGCRGNDGPRCHATAAHRPS